MKKLTFAVLCVALVFGLRTSHASGPIGIYGIIDKVVFEPNEKSPERIQVWGAFAYVDGGANRDLGVSPAKRGYLYFKLPENGSATEAMAQKEWADLKSTAGTGQCLGLGSRYQEKGTVRDEAAKPKDPDTYPVALGLTKVNGKTYKPIKELIELSASKPARPGSK